MKDSIKKILKEYLNEKNFSQYNEVLRQEIIRIFVKKIQEKNSFFLYSNLVELLESVENYLDSKDIMIFTRFYDLCKSEYESDELSRYLTDVYEKMIV